MLAHHHWDRGQEVKLLHNGTWGTIPARDELDIERPIFADAMLQGKKRENRWEQFLSGWDPGFSTIGPGGSPKWKPGGRWRGKV
jgi:hypothetical protein